MQQSTSTGNASSTTWQLEGDFSHRTSTVLGRQLGDELRRHREAAGLSTTQAAQEIDCTKGKISRMENGRVLVRTPDVIALLKAYGVTDSEIHERMTRLTRTANRRRREGWWHQYGALLAPPTGTTSRWRPSATASGPSRRS
ncbi:helix-turn-helix transcriptional regulator [Streptomyces sp. NPDC050095]|uniref:helix-turn-helix domain-containing protein n=1 Tax=unclassified Streptomyces TaxID=2593676 RepID=UPI00342B1BFF